MLKFDDSIWSVHDPDKVLSCDKPNSDESILKFLGDIHPREDLMNFENKHSKYIVDFGYYGCEVELDGSWVAYVIDGNIEDAWDEPVERYETKTFLDGIASVQAMLNKYT